MLSIKNLALIGLLAALAAEARPVAQPQGYDWSEAGQLGGQISQGSVTRTGGLGESYGGGRWGNHHRHRPSGPQSGGPAFTGRPGGIGSGDGYGGGSAAGGWGGPSRGGTDNERPSFPEATGRPSSLSRPSGSGMGSVVVPSDIGAQPTPGAPDGPIGSGLSPTATISEAPMETFPIVSDDLGENAGGSATPAVPVATPTLTDVEVPKVSPSVSAGAAGIIPIESGSAPAPIVTIPVEGSQSGVGENDQAEPDSLATPSPSPMGNMAFRYGASWNRPAGTRSINTPSAQSGSPTIPVAQPGATDPVPTLVEPSTQWETNPGSGPIIDQNEPVSSLVGTPQASASTRTSVLNANIPAASASVKPQPAPEPASGGSGGKAGLAVNGASGSAWSSWTGGDITWLYNWDSAPPANLPSSTEYVPQLWGADKVDGFNANLPKFDSWGVSHVLSFNEPDQARSVGGSEISPAEAARVHKQVFTADLAGKYKTGAPAVARGGKQWLSDWVDSCAGGCAYDFIPIHYYGKDPSQFAPYLKEMTSFGKPLWVTEVACIEFGATTYYCNEAEATAFMKQIVSDMADPANNVERHSWFGAFTDMTNSNKIMNADGTPNALGQVYLGKA